jgi:large subunit ribosomal protein L18
MDKMLNKKRRKARIRAKISGTATRPRLSVYKSNTHNYAALIDDTQGKTLVSVSDMKEKAKGNTEAAKKIGLKLAEEAKKQKIETCVFDRNAYKYHGRVKALADGAREGGLKF